MYNLYGIQNISDSQYLSLNISLYYIQDYYPDDSTAPSTTCSITIDVSQLGRQHQQLTQQPTQDQRPRRITSQPGTDANAHNEQTPEPYYE